MADRPHEAISVLHNLGIAVSAATAVMLTSLAWSATGLAPQPAAMAPWMDFVVGGYAALLICMVQKRRAVAAIVVAVPVTLFIIGGTAVLMTFNEPLSLSHLLLIDEGIAFYGIETVVAIAGGVLAVLFVANLRVPGRYFTWALMPLVVIVGLFGAKAAFYGRDDGRLMENINWWHGDDFSADVGYFAGFVLDGLVHFERRRAYRRLVAEHGTPVFEDFLTAALSTTAPTPRTIHLILVESFIDPTRNTEATFSRDPLPARIRGWLSEQGVHGLSPVFGARSPDAEFEMLCGIPAPLDDRQVVMADLAVDTLDCLPRKLAALGWPTVAAQPINPGIFKTGRAYKAVGFSDSRFAAHFDMSDVDSSDFSVGSGKVTVLDTLSSESLLRQFAEILRPRMTAGGRLFSYVFLTGGHYPFGLDETQRPPVIRTNGANALYDRYVNSVHYNARAIEVYIQQIFEMDPSALIIVTGDHGPPISQAVRVTSDGSTGKWNPVTLRHMVPFVMLRNGRVNPVPLAVLPTYLIPELVLDALSDGAFCDANRCRKDGQQIFRPLADRVHVYDRSGHYLQSCGGGRDDDKECRDAMKFFNASKLRLLDLLFPSSVS